MRFMIFLHLLAAPATAPAGTNGVIYFDSPVIEWAFYIFAVLLALGLLYLGFRLGRWAGANASARLIAAREQELFTAQRGFKTLYEQELLTLKAENAKLTEQVNTLNSRVEEYRKKAAGFGGLFSSGGKKADAMYALLLENEALEDALYAQNEKLRAERTDALKESMRNTSYRRVLMSQLLNDDRIKEVVAEIVNSDRHLPAPHNQGGSGHERE
jgi:cell division protein FtsB